jgi:hypothetical protein
VKTTLRVKRSVHHVTLSSQKLVADFHENRANDSTPGDGDRQETVSQSYLIGRCYHEPRPDLLTETILLQRLYIID